LFEFKKDLNNLFTDLPKNKKLFMVLTMLQKIYKSGQSTEILEILLQECQKVAKYQVDNFRKDFKTKQKSSFRDLVTEIDITSQNMLEKGILKQLLEKKYVQNEVGFYGEESKTREIKKFTFIIDPIDGTLNFATGFPSFSISIGVLIDSQFEAGIIFEPLKNQAFVGIKNQGSYRLDLDTKEYQKLEIKEKNINQCVIGGNFDVLKNLPKEILTQVLGVRTLFGFALSNCMVAENIIQANFSKHPKIWDIAAALIIVKEAGGEILDLSSKKVLEFDLNNPSKEYPCITCHLKTMDLF
jgi:myo-inositol-1(or 4)-monophosphatase